MNRLIHIHLALLLFSFSSYSQICKGIVLDAMTEEPIVNANVFLQNSLVGTITNDRGEFLLDATGVNFLPLVVSSLGYETLLIENGYKGKILKVLLKEKVYEIDNVDIYSKASAWSRKKMVIKFYDEFIGESKIAKTCVIQNIDDVYLYFNEKTKVLHAVSKKPIEIRNKALGYNINFTLEYFQWTKKRTRYKGYSVFSEHIFSGKKEMKKVERRRKNNYLGSPMHFFRALYEHNLGQYRFSVYLKDDTEVAIKELYRMIEQNNEKAHFVLSEPLLVQYGMKHAKAKITPYKQSIQLNSAGYGDPEEFDMNGYFAQYRVGDMLPFDYDLH